MALKIRLSRGGSKKRPFYRIVVAEAAAPRDGRYVERIGHYNPMVAKDNDQRLVVDGERVKHWMGLGAKPTERVQKLLASLSLTAPVEMRDQPKKSAPGKKRAEREAEAAATAEAAAAEAAAAAEEAALLKLKPRLKRLRQKKRQLKKLLLKPLLKKLQLKPLPKKLLQKIHRPKKHRQKKKLPLTKKSQLRHRQKIPQGRREYLSALLV